MLISLPDSVIWLITLLSIGVTLYYVAIISGLYKDTLLARFRSYGEEHPLYPICRFLLAAGIMLLLIGYMLRSLIRSGIVLQSDFTSMIFTVLALMCFGASLLIRRQAYLREALPAWYFDLLRNATRQERRFIGYAWLRLPFKMRWRLNGDQAAFHVWADMVRISVIYGAYDPENPWLTWG